MNKSLVLFSLPLILLVGILAGISSIHQVRASGFPTGPGTVCLLDSSAVASLNPPGPCQSYGPYVFDGPFPSAPQTAPTQLRVGVYVNGSAGLDGFSIILVADSTVLQPAGFDLTGTLLSGTPIVVSECLSNVLIQGTNCSPADNANTLELAATSAVGQPNTPSPTSGLLFTAIYNIVGDSPAAGVSIGFQVDVSCNQSSVIGNMCVTIANGTTIPVPETVQSGTQFNNSACATICTVPWVALTSNVTAITLPRGASTGNNVAVIANAENGWPGFSTDTVTFTAVQTSGASAPVFAGGISSCPTLGTSCSVVLTANTATAGSYFITVYGTYVAFDTAIVAQPTVTLVGSVKIQVNVQDVLWSINGVSASSAQTLYMAQGPSNPMTLSFRVQSLGGYSGTIAFSTATLNDGGTGVTFAYPNPFAIGSGQTVTTLVNVTASSYGTSSALYGTQLTASGLTIQSSGAFTIHVVGVALSTNTASATFTAGGSASVTLTTQSLPATSLGFAGKVTVSKSVSGGALTVTCPSSLTLAAGGIASGSCNFTGSTAGIFTVTMKGTAGTNGDITNSTAVTVTVQSGAGAGINIKATPASVSGVVGSAPFSSISLSSVGGFSGSITIFESVAPSGLSCSFSSTGATIPPTATVTLSCSSIVAGTYPVTVTVTGGAVTNSTVVTFILTDFTLSASSPGAANAGASVSSTIGVGSVDGTSGTVTLSDTVPSGLTCSPIAPSIVSGPATATLSCASSNAATYTVTITGSDGSLTHQTTAIFTFADFTINASPIMVTMNTGDTASITITVSPVNGFAGTVSLSPNPSVGLTATLSSSSVSGGSGTVTLSVGAMSPATYTVDVTGSSGSLSHTTQTIAIQVIDFQIFSSPTIINTSPSVAATSMITVSPVNGFTGTVALSVSVAPGTGLTCSLTSTSIMGGSGTSQLSCTGTGGTYVVTVTGSNGALSHSTMVAANVADFTISASPSSLTVAQGPPGAMTTITVSSQGGFSGMVTLTANGPAGFSTPLSPTSVSMSGTSTLTILVSPPATPGVYSVTVTGTSGSLSHSVTITVTVTSSVTVQPPFFSQLTWNHRFSLAKFNNVMTFKFGVGNNSTSTTIYFSVTITGTNGENTFTLSSPSASIGPNKNLSNLSLSQTFSPSLIGDTFAFSAVIHWGTTATTDPSQLQFTSSQTNGAPTSGSFTVLP